LVLPAPRFSKKIENHEGAIALHYMHYNFALIHQTLRVTPAMEAGISNHVWTLEEIVGLLPLFRDVTGSGLVAHEKSHVHCFMGGRLLCCDFDCWYDLPSYNQQA
jgi:hypothetical protein